MKDLRLIIFDLDGTLVDAYKAITDSFNYTMRSIGARQRNSSVIRRSVGWGDENLLKPFIKERDLKKASSYTAGIIERPLLKAQGFIRGQKSYCAI